MIVPERFAALERVAIVLDALNLEYAVVGSIAASRWGVPRLTNDVDIVADLGPALEAEFVRLVSVSFFVDERSVARAVADRGAFNLVARDDFTKVDVFVTDHTAWQRSQLHRRRLEAMPPEVSTRPVYIAAPEDTILAKLQWFEQGGRVSDRQWNDVVAIARVQGAELDRAYLDEWAERLAVRELLAHALAEAGRSPA